MRNLDQDERPDYEETAKEHADFIVKRLEQFIRSGRTANEGMSFKKWQSLARAEITKSILETRARCSKEDKFSNLIIFATAAAMITVGFWGAAVSLEKADLLFAAIICLTAGFIVLLLLMWIRMKRYREHKDKLERVASLLHIESLNKRIKRLERELETEEAERKKQVEKLRKPFGTSLFDTLN